MKQISAKLDGLSATIKKIGKESEKREKAAREENSESQIKQMKLQIYADRCHAVLSTRISFSLVVFGLVVIFYPLYIQATLAGNPLSPTGFAGLGGTIFVTVVAALLLRNYIQKYNGEIKRISDMVEMVRKGDAVPPLEDIDKHT